MDEQTLIQEIEGLVLLNQNRKRFVDFIVDWVQENNDEPIQEIEYNNILSFSKQQLLDVIISSSYHQPYQDFMRQKLAKSSKEELANILLTHFYRGGDPNREIYLFREKVQDIPNSVYINVFLDTLPDVDKLELDYLLQKFKKWNRQTIKKI